MSIYFLFRPIIWLCKLYIIVLVCKVDWFKNFVIAWATYKCFFSTQIFNATWHSISFLHFWKQHIWVTTLQPTNLIFVCRESERKVIHIVLCMLEGNSTICVRILRTCTICHFKLSTLQPFLHATMLLYPLPHTARPYWMLNMPQKREDTIIDPIIKGAQHASPLKKSKEIDSKMIPYCPLKWQ